MRDPPEDIAPEDLFRRLLVLPRPTVPISYRIAGADEVALAVRAISGAEYGDGDPLAVIAAAVVIDGRPAFRSADSVKRLYAWEAEQLCNHVAEALARCSPIFGLSNLFTWTRKLRVGAAHPSNQLTTQTLGSSFEMAGRLLLDRPERFFGITPRELVDAHWFAYRAAKAHFLDEMR